MSGDRLYTFSDSQRLVPGTVAKSVDVNSIVDGIQAGFDATTLELNRALKLPAGDAGAEHNFAADAATRAGKLLQFDASGNPVASSQLLADIDANSHRVTNLASPAASGDAVTLGYLNAFSGALAGLPSIVGQSGKYVTTDGVTVFWATIPGIPAQSAPTTGKVLMSDGTSASWQTSPNQVPATSTNAGVSLSHDGTTFSFRNEGANLVFNPDGAVNYGGTAVGWTSTTVTMTPTLGARGWRFETGVLVSQTGQTDCARFAFPPNTDITVSGNIDATAKTGGTASLLVNFFDSGGGSLGTSSVSVASGVERRCAVTTTSPATCATVSVSLAFGNTSCSAAIGINNVKAERGTNATPFNDATTIAWAAGFLALTEFGRGFVSPIVRIGDATSTGAKLWMKSAAGTQNDFELAITGGTNGTDGRADVAMQARSIKNTGVIGYALEFDAGNSGSAIGIDFVNHGPKQRLLMTAAATITIATMPSVVGQYRVKITQNGTGNFLPTFAGVSVTWAGSNAPTALAANAVMFVDLYYDGATLWGSWTPW